MSETKSNNYDNVRGNTTPGYLDSGNGLKYACESVNPNYDNINPYLLQSMGDNWAYKTTTNQVFANLIMYGADFEELNKKEISVDSFRFNDHKVLYRACKESHEIFQKITQPIICDLLVKMERADLINHLNNLLNYPQLSQEKYALKVLEFSLLEKPERHKNSHEYLVDDLRGQIREILFDLGAIQDLKKEIVNQGLINIYEFNEVLFDERQKHSKQLAASLLEKNLSSSELEIEFAKYKANKLDIKSIYWQLQKEQEDLEEKKLFTPLIRSQKKCNYLPEKLKMCSLHAKNLGWDELAIMECLIAAISGIIHGEFEVEVHDGWSEKLISWVCLIATSGKGKSPFIKPVRKALGKLENQAADAYMDDYQHYQSLLAEWEKGDKNPGDKPIEPQYRTFIQSSFTMEAVCAQFQRQGNRGITFFYDELSAHFAAMNQYRNGDDKEAWLQFYDGNISPKLRMKSDDRLGGSLMTGNSFNCQMGIIGGIQPEVFQDLLSQTNLRSAGHFARFNYLWMENKPLTLEEVISGGSAVDVTEDIYKLLVWAAQLPGQKFMFSPDAFKYIVTKISLMETKAMEENNQIMAEFLNKFPGKFLRHCGLLHLLFSYPNEPTNLIRKSVCQVAFDSIVQQQYFIEKVCLLKPEPALSDMLKSLLDYCQRKDKFLSGSDIVTSKKFDKVKPKFTAQVARSYFKDLAEMGYGQLEGSGTRLRFKAFTQNPVEIAETKS